MRRISLLFLCGLSIAAGPPPRTSAVPLIGSGFEFYSDSISSRPKSCAVGSAGVIVLRAPDGSPYIEPLPGVITLYDTETGAKIRDLIGHLDEVERVAMSDNGKRLISADASGTVIVWQTRTGSILYRHRFAVGDSPRVALSKDGRMAAFASGNDVVIRDMQKKKNVLEIKRSSSVCQMGFSPDSRWVAVADVDLTIYEVASGIERATMVGHTAPILSIVFSHDSEKVFTGSGDTTLRAWRRSSGKEEFAIPCGFMVHEIGQCPQEKNLLLVRTHSAMRVVDSRSGKVLHIRKSPDYGFRSSCFSKPGQYTVIEKRDGRLRSQVVTWRADR